MSQYDDLLAKYGVQPAEQNGEDEYDALLKKYSGDVQADKPKDTRGITDIYKDVSLGMFEGMQNVQAGIGGLWGLATGDMDNRKLREAKDLAKQARAGMSTYQQDKDRSSQVAVEKAEKEGGFWSGLGEGIMQGLDDPMMAISRQLPLLAVGGISGGATKAAAGQFIRQATEKTMIELGAAGAVASMAAMQGSDIGADAYERVLAIKPETWAKNVDFQALIKQGESEDAAKHAIALREGRIAAAKAAAISIASQKLPGGSTLEKVMMGAGGKGGIAGMGIGALKGAAGESLQESIEEGGGQKFSNEAVQAVDPTQSSMQGVGGAAGQGAAVAAILGGTAGGVSGFTPSDTQAAHPAGTSPLSLPPTAAGASPLAAPPPLNQANPGASVFPDVNESIQADELVQADAANPVDRMAELDAEYANLQARKQELNDPANGYGPMFDTDRAEIFTRQMEIAQERAELELGRTAPPVDVAPTTAPLNTTQTAAASMDEVRRQNEQRIQRMIDLAASRGDFEPVKTLPTGTPVVGNRAVSSIPSGRIAQVLDATTNPNERIALEQEMARRGMEVPVAVEPTPTVQEIAAKTASSPIESTARTLNEDGRATDGKPINPGDVFRTLSGRNATPYPKQKSEKYASQWLIENATAEAESRGDNFNALTFKNSKPLKDGTLTTADREGMLMYLFSQQPDVVPSILKPLTGEAIAPKPSQPAQKESQAQGAEGKTESALDRALRSVGIDPNAPVEPAKELRRKAEKLMKEATAMLDRIPPGQPISSARDRNLREKSAEKARKASDLYAEAERLEILKNGMESSDKTSQIKGQNSSTDNSKKERIQADTRSNREQKETKTGFDETDSTKPDEVSAFDQRYPTIAAAEQAIKAKKLKQVAVFKDGDQYRIGAKNAGKAAPSNNLIQRIKQLGGIHTRYRADVIGDKAGAPGLFSNTGKGLEDLATALQAEGFAIDTAEAGGGVDALTALIQRAVNSGETVLNYAGQQAAAEKKISDDFRDNLKEEIAKLGGNPARNATTKQLIEMRENLRAVAQQKTIEAAAQIETLIGKELTGADWDAILNASLPSVDQYAADLDQAALMQREQEENDAAYRRHEEETQVAAGQAAPRGARQGAETGRAEPGNQEAQESREAFGLTGETPEEIRAREEAQAAKAKSEQDAADKAEAEAKKKRIDAEVASRQKASAENFVLGQGAEDALAGQGDIFGGLTQQEVSQEAESIEQLRDKLRKIEDKILLAAGERDNIEQAMSSRKVDKSLKDKRNTIRDQVRAAQKRLDDAQKQPATSTETPAGQRKATLEERIASEKASHVLDLNKAQTGWKRIDGANNEAVTLVSYDGKVAVPFLTKDKKSGTASVRMNAEAHAYAIDNPYRAAPIPEGELIAKPLYAEAETPAGQPAANATTPAQKAQDSVDTAVADALSKMERDAEERTRKANASTLAANWDSMTDDERLDAGVKSGWVTAAGKPNFVAKRLAKLAWDEITDGTKATLAEKNAATTAQPAQKAPDSAAGKPAVSQNTVFTEDVAAAARARLKAKLGRLNTGLDPETMLDGITLAGYHIEKGARTFAAYAKAMIEDLGDAVKPYLKSWYAAVSMDPRASGFDGLDDLAAVQSSDIEAILKETGDTNEPDQRGGTDLERDRQNTRNQNDMGAQGVRPGRERDGGPGEPGVRRPAQENQPAGGERVPGREAAPAGTESDFSPFAEAPGAEPGVAGSDLDQRSGDLGLFGQTLEPAGTEATDRVAQGGIGLIEKRQAQTKAQNVKVVPGNRANISESLPFLLEGQKDDVAFAEARFAKPDGYGVLFTNGTGTGKTYSGLGVIKRFERQGKSNILIVVPSDKIASDWVRSGQDLKLDITALENTNDAGQGIVITTYANMGANNALVNRKWDLVVADESHYMMQAKDGGSTQALDNLRAITMHPRGRFERHSRLYAKEIARRSELIDKITFNSRIMNLDDTMDQMIAALRDENATMEAEAKKLDDFLREKREQVKEEVDAAQGINRTRTVFLSATPFAYEKTVDYAEGYLFNYAPDGARGGYNSGSPFDRFMMQHFGYRMRYNKLNEPGPEVNRGLMQRQFNSWLKSEKVLSGRILDVEHDYDRKFILVDSAIGAELDRAMQWIWDRARDQTNPNKEGYSALQSKLSEKFDHLTRRYLLEAIKAKEAIPIIRAHLDMGRKVVVFHDFKKGGGFNPVRFGKVDATQASEKNIVLAYNAAIEAFNAEFSDLIESPMWNAASPIDALSAAFPDALLFNGDVPAKKRRENATLFNDDESGKNLIIGQSAAMKEGVSLHDTTGKHQRVLINLGLPTQPTTAIQQEGRIFRVGQASNAIFRYLNTGTNWERFAFATSVAQRASAAENLAVGEEARALMDAFIEGFEESDTYPAGHDGEGTGGKARDQAANQALTEWDRAMTLYWAQQKKTSRTKAQEGVDYFATPEPLGLKMVEWADIRDGDKSLEPSAGHGAIARWLPDNIARTVIEPSAELSSRLRMVMMGDGVRLLQEQFEQLDTAANKYDAIVMNPPFGSGGSTAIQHVAKAAKHLNNGGRIVALIPTGPAADKKFEKWFYEEEQKPVKPLVEHPKLGPIYKGDTIKTNASWMPEGKVVRLDAGGNVYLKNGPSETTVNPAAWTELISAGPRTETIRPAENLYLRADIKLPQVTFERAGTRVAARVVVIEKQTDKDAIAQIQQVNRDFSDADDIKDFFARIQDSSIPTRAIPKNAFAGVSPLPAATGQPSAEGKKLETDAEEIAYTTKKGKVLHGVIAKDITEAQAKEYDPYTWKKDGGFFIRMEHVKRPNEGETNKPNDTKFSRAIRTGDFLLIENPTRDQAENLLRRSKYQSMRGLRDPETGKLYIWDANDAIHHQVARELGITDDVYERLEFDDVGALRKGVFSGEPGYGGVITDRPSAYEVREIRMSRKGGAAKGIALRDLNAMVDRVRKSMDNLPTVHVLTSPMALDLNNPSQARLREFIEQAGALEDVEGAAHEGEIYLFASGLADEARAEHVLAVHEITHYGLRAVFGMDLDPVLQSIWATNANIRKQATALREKLGLASNVAAVEEILADMEPAELVKLTGWRRLAQLVRDWFRGHGFTALADRIDSLLKAGLDGQRQADLLVADVVNAARGWVKGGKRAGKVASGTALQRVWHGTPHIWAPEPGFPHGRPRLDKMGSGEGNQAYGWGWYSAEAQSVAGSYASQLRNPVELDGKKPDTMRMGFAETATINYFQNRLAAKIGEDRARQQTAAWAKHNVQINGDMADAEIDAFIARLSEGKGNLYHLDIPDATLPYLLDWDRPLSEQTQEVQKALLDAFPDPESEKKRWDRWTQPGWARKNGQPEDVRYEDVVEAGTIYTALAGQLGSYQKASEALARHGIVGNRYLDGQSRNRPLKDIKREFLAELPEDADTSEVAELIGTGKFSPKNDAMLRALKNDDWLGFDYPAQAVSTALSNDLSGYDASPELIRAVADAKEGGTYNFVIWDQPTLDKIALLERNGEKLDAMREADAQFSRKLADDLPAQEKWLNAEARMRGFQDIEDLAAKDYKVFENLAKLWREKHPADVMMSRARQSQLPGVQQSPPAPPPSQQSANLQGGASGNQSVFNTPEPSKMDDAIFKLADKHIDLKRVIQAIEATGRQIADKWNAYRNEELFHGRSADRVKKFNDREMAPMLREMALRKVSISDLDKYLWARHAKEANALIEQRDPGVMVDDVTGQPKGSGMTDQEADDYFAGLSQEQRNQLDAIARKVDGMIAKTRDLYVSYGLENRDTVQGWADMFQHYVPLMREDHDGGMGIGQGFSIKGREAKHRTGSTRAVADVLANIATQRERAIVRGEKNRVAVSLAGLVKLNPAPDFWTLDKIPQERVLNEHTGLVETREVPNYRTRDNVIIAKIKDSNGNVQERAIVLNENDERAVRLAKSMKNIDIPMLEGWLGAAAAVTRYFSAINTQYNPVFGVVNLIRDTGTGALNLSSTALKGKERVVTNPRRIASAVAGIYSDARKERKGQVGTSPWATLWEEFTNEGGQTGYRDMFRTSNERANAMQQVMDPTSWTESKWGQFFTANGALKVPLVTAQKAATPLFNWLSDFNLAMENAVRLSAYKEAVDSGMSKQQAASLAKNLTVNFNRKGAWGAQAGALYAFFNAATQGTARIGETLTRRDHVTGKYSVSGIGKKIIGGGVMLGVMQAVALAMAGYDDDEPPEFIRERNLVVPLMDGKYISIPMPLGFHVIPNIGRIATETIMGRRGSAIEGVIDLMGITFEAFNPMGSAGWSTQTVLPTVFDPMAAIIENKDWTGKPIAKEKFSNTDPEPGFSMAKDNASSVSTAIAYAINLATGGSEYTAGKVSPTPDQIDYLWGQVTGGVGREGNKLYQSVESMFTGEELPPHKIPLAGRLYGNTQSSSAMNSRFYDNIRDMKRHKAEYMGRMKDGDTEGAQQYLADNPEAEMIRAVGAYESKVQQLRSAKRKAIEQGDSERAKEIEQRTKELMEQFNQQIGSAKQ